jgi:hypothetical protein
LGQGLDRRHVERRAVDVDGFELDAALESGVNQVGAFEDADALAPSQ